MDPRDQLRETAQGGLERGRGGIDRGRRKVIERAENAQTRFNEIEEIDTSGGFNPRETGPLDVYRKIKAVLDEFSRELLAIGAAVLLLGMVLNAVYGWSPSRPPDWFMVLSMASIGGLEGLQP